MAQTEDDSNRARAFAPVLVLLAISVLINYVDRGNLSIAAPLLKDELGISASQLGILLAAFFWTYTAMQFVVGWLARRDHPVQGSPQCAVESSNKKEISHGRVSSQTR